MNKNEAIRKLTLLRDKLARKTGMENFKILKYETIELIAISQPETLDELLEVKGIGKKKLEQFGQMILDTIHENNSNIQDDLFTAVSTEPRKIAMLTRGRYRALSTEHSDIMRDSHRAGTVQDILDFSSLNNKKRGNKEAVLSVGEFLDRVNNLMEDMFSEVVIIGEITELNEHSSGIYLTLKDKEQEGVLNCYIPPGVYREFGFSLDEGMEIKITGVPNIWKPKGRFSMRVESVELAGEGTLKKAYELLKKKLEAEGLFERKRDVPEFITNIGVITSRTGAVINDFRNNLISLGIKINFFDSRVEGANAVGDIRRGIKFFNINMPELDALIIIRGGGSLEDLQAFNNELVVRDIFSSRIPTICGIGHDRDIPISCLVADRAESTPTAVAILINNSWDRLVTELSNYKKDIINNYGNIINKANLKLRSYSLSLNYHTSNLGALSDKYLVKLNNAIDKIGDEIKRSGEFLKLSTGNLVSVFTRELEIRNKNIEQYQIYLNNVSPERNLKLGYSVTVGGDGKVVRMAQDVKVGDDIKTKLYKGEFKSRINKIN